jgi:hypothetical protein
VRVALRDLELRVPGEDAHELRAYAAVEQRGDEEVADGVEAPFAHPFGTTERLEPPKDLLTAGRAPALGDDGSFRFMAGSRIARSSGMRGTRRSAPDLGVDTTSLESARRMVTRLLVSETLHAHLADLTLAAPVNAEMAVASTTHVIVTTRATCVTSACDGASGSFLGLRGKGRL